MNPRRRCRRLRSCAWALLAVALTPGLTGCEAIAGIRDVKRGSGGAAGGADGGAGGPACAPAPVEAPSDCVITHLFADYVIALSPEMKAAGYACVRAGSFVEAGASEWIGGIHIAESDPDRLTAVVEPNEPTGQLHAISLARGSGCHIEALGESQKIADVDSVDGMARGPGGAYFFGRASKNGVDPAVTGVARMAMESAALDQWVDLAPFGVDLPVTGVGFIPAGLPGAGTLVATTYPFQYTTVGGSWYAIELAGDGAGPLEVAAVTAKTELVGPSSFAFLPAGSPGFAADTVLISDFPSRSIFAYDLDADGAPVAASARTILTAPLEAEFNLWGITRDPRTGDLLIVVFGRGELLAIHGFAP